MKKTTTLVLLVITLFFSTLSFAQTFDISDASTVDNTSGSNPKTVVETLSGTIMTVRIQRANTANPDLTDYLNTADLAGAIGTTNGAVFQASSSETGTMSIEFNTPVDIANVKMGSTQTTQTRTWTFTPIGGTNSNVTETSNFVGNVVSIPLNWTGVTRIEINSDATGLEQFVLDSVTLGAPANTAPSIISYGASPIATASATLNGNVTNNGGESITERGFVYALTATDATPTVAESAGANVTKVIVSGELGVYNEMISGLTASSDYSYAAYAINSVGTTESTVQTFTTIADVDDCIAINAFDSASTFASNLNLGQSFVACQTGTIKSIGVLVAFNQTSTNETINVYTGTTINSGNLLGSVTNQDFTENGGDPNNLDVTDFSSQNISVVAGQTYTFDIPTTVNLVYSGDNGYPNGTLYLDTVENVGNFDLVFKVEIETETLGVAEYTKNDIKIYPNPAKNQIQISSKTPIQGDAILYNILGKAIKSFKLENAIIDISNLNSGVYLLELKTDKGVFVKRIIKE